MIYVVVGMHKCGTTLVSQLMHEMGISMIEYLPLLRLPILYTHIYGNEYCKYSDGARWISHSS